VIRISFKITRIDSFALRMAILYAALFAFNGIQLPYLPVWLETKGLDAREIGIVLAIPMLIRVVAVPFAVRLVDRRFVHTMALKLATVLATAGYAVIGIAEGFPAIVIVYMAISVVYAPLLPLADSYALRGLKARGLAYGPVRLWGSIAFILANVGGGIFLAALGAANVVWMLTAAMAATAAAALPLTPDSRDAGPENHASSGHWRSGLFVTTVVGASLIQASHAVMYGFASLQWSAKGLGGTSIGLLWAIGVVAEVLLFAASNRAIAHIGAVNMILVGGAGRCPALDRHGA